MGGGVREEIGRDREDEGWGIERWVCSSLFLKHSYKHLSCTAVAISISITELELLIQEPVQGRRQLMVSEPA